MSAVSAVAIALTGADQAVLAGPGVYRGIVLRETAASTAVVQIWDGTGAAGTLLDVVGLAASGSAREWLGDGGLRFKTGLYVEIVSGAVEGSVRIG
jgi:hypothetical protein